MKKFFSIISVLLIFCMLFTACGGESMDSESATESESETETETETENGSETESETEKETETNASDKEEKYMERTYTMAQAKGYYRELGRVKESNGVLLCDWNATGAEFVADCVGDVKMTFSYTSGSSKYLAVYVDDAFYKDIVLSSGTKTYTIAEDLPKGLHVIRVVTGYTRGKGSMNDISFVGKLIKNPASDVYVEILGDSITSGAFLSPDESDYAPKAYAYLAMEKLNVDYAICAQGGMPMCLPSSINSTYPFFNKNRDNSLYVPNRKADLVIINLGTNDNWQWFKQANNKTDHEVFNYEAFDAEMATFFANLDKIHGEKAVPILFVFGCTTNPNYTVGTDRMQELIKNVYIPAGYDIEIAFLTTNRAGKDGHPNAVGAKQQSEDLVAFLKNTYPEIFG